MTESFRPPGDGAELFAARLEEGVRSSERAVLALGGLIEDIVRLATSPVAGADSCRAEDAFAARLEGLVSASAAFVAETRAFVRGQVDFAQSANAAFRAIHKSATGVSDLTVKSRLLALNLRIEAGRGSSDPGALQVVGREMVQLSVDIRTASDAIVRSLDGLSGSLPQLESGARGMDDRAQEFATDLGARLETIRGDVSALRDSQAEKLRQVEGRNRQVIGLAHRAMSELQFQDPLAQNIRAALAAFADSPPDPTLDAPIARSAVGDTDPDRTAGEVDLF